MLKNNTPTSIKNSNRHGINIEILWFLVILAGFLFFASLFPLPPNDFWWHLKIGNFIYSTRTIPTTNMYAWTIPANQPFFYAAWLGEFLLYLFYKLGGVALIIFVRTLLLALTFGLVAYESHRQSGSWRISAFVITLLCLMSTNNLIVRTQMWAWLPFIVIYIVLQRYSEGIGRWQWLLLCPASMIFWVNVHGSYILGLGLVAIFFIGSILSKLLKQVYSLSWRQIAWMGAVGLLSALAVLVNPRFLDIIRYTVNLLSNQPIQQLIDEWQPTTPHGIANVTFYVGILLFIAVTAYSSLKLKITDLLLVIGFLWLAWNGQRSVIWYGLVVVPVLARLISALPIRTPTFVPQKNWINLVLAIALFIPVILVQPWFVENIPLPSPYWQQVLRHSPAGPLLTVNTPVSAGEYLRGHPGGHLFNELGYGSYLIWAVPDQGVFIDPRIELYTYEQWQDYIDINNGFRYDQLLAKYGVDRILLDKKLQPRLAASLSTDQIWALEYQDEYAQLWSRASNP